MKLIFSTVRKLILLAIMATALLVVLVYLIRSNEALVPSAQKVSPARVEQAKKSLHNIAHQLNNSVGDVEFYFNQPQVDAIMAVASYAVPKTRFQTNLSAVGIEMAATTEIKTPYFSQFINLQCRLLPKQQKLAIENCLLGQLTLPDWLVSWGVKRALLVIFEDQLTNNVLNMVQQAQLADRSLRLKLHIREGMKQEVLTALHKNAASENLAASAISANVTPQIVSVYLVELQALIDTFSSTSDASSLAFYIGKMLYLAELRTPASDASTENQAALWALATTFGNKRFGHFVGIERTQLDQLKRPTVKLAGRNDLSLHFLYSAILERLVKVQMGLKVGELKELLDTNEGGSGFSFADLTADKTGLAFADTLINQPLHAQRLLAGSHDEALFFPGISGMTEGLSEAEFNQDFGSTESAEYQAVAGLIDKRIAQLPLYSALNQNN